MHVASHRDLQIDVLYNLANLFLNVLSSTMKIICSINCSMWMVFCVDFVRSLYQEIRYLIFQLFLYLLLIHK